MSSPIQPPPPNIRSPSVGSQQPSIPSPYAHHLPPPNLSNSQPNANGPLPPPPRVTELPPLLSSSQSPRSSSPSFSSHHTLPPASSLSSEHTLPPIPPRTSTPPFAERRSSIARAPIGPPPSTSVLSHPPQQHSQQSNVGYRPLNVRDALTYLDQVKVRFSDQPDVYNRFLDIMKDFKSQAIDTPGVIERVSTLFKGHPTLISGFNTFLPPGYRIECSTDPREPDLITVTTPNGVTTTTGGSGRIQPIYHQPPLPSAPPSNMPRPSQQQPQQPQPQQHAPVSIHHSPTQTNNEKRSPVEFNHAINYVNKIKNRFANEPEIYKQFLEILQTYQKDQKPIQEVYAHVQYLFSSAPDLLDEFKQFLPDITGQPASNLFDTISPTYYSGSKRSAIGTPPPHGITLRDPYSYPNSPFDPVRPSVSAEEIELFDRIRKHIGNKPSYEEFLKTLNLYTQQIFDLKTLIEQVSIFIGNNKELFEWFKSVVGYEPKDHPIEKPSAIIPKPDLAHCKTTTDSPSYRVVPKNWQSQPCSGRDQIAWEVLNDEYVSHPIWASEDDGFVASRKSQYEEAMHRCEEERYDYNMNIDANLNVIALLEPIAHRIESMTAEEKANFKLRPGLGGQSVSIYERIIKKIYDKERGMEIIELLYCNPAQVVPILLKRLKQKDEEWKRAQREWNKIWREVDAKNFYRALDYQGITFKSNDRKAMAPKGLVAEIELLHHEKKLKLNDSKPTHSTASYQFKFPFDEASVFKDVTRVIYSFIDRQSGYTSSDREKIRTFVQTFVPLCFQVDDVVPEGVQYASEAEDEEMAEDDDDNHSTNTEESESDIGQSPSKRNMSPRRRMGRSSRHHHEDEHTMDLLRDVLTKNQNALDEINEPSGDKLLAAAATVVAPGVRKRTLFSFFCNTTFYCFFRLYEMLYSRLNKLRALDAEMQANPHMGKRVNKVARDLGLYNNRFEGKRKREVGYNRTKGTDDCCHDTIEIDTSKGCYQAVLEMIDRFFDGDIDQQVFEEHTRYVFVTDAYLIFTIDKLVHSMVKQVRKKKKSYM
ncbi:hypothetical protein EDC96DRAFT_452540 [Choanephora cucurbitarum]|nr:hypothetical protein EDC96DRAFT_452540 [Choanephora cucurbitarum]